MIPQTNNSYIFKIAPTFYFGFPSGIVKNTIFVSNFSSSSVLLTSYGLNGHGLYDTHIMQYA